MSQDLFKHHIWIVIVVQSLFPIDGFLGCAGKGKDEGGNFLEYQKREH